MAEKELFGHTNNNKKDDGQALFYSCGKRTPNNTTDAVADSQHQEQQQQQNPPRQRTNELPDNHHKQHKSPASEQQRQRQKKKKIGVIMDKGRTRATISNEEETEPNHQDETEVNHQEVLPMPPPPPAAAEIDTFGSGNHHGSFATPSDETPNLGQTDGYAAGGTNESLNNHRQQQKSLSTEHEIGVMDIVRKRAIMAREEETELNHQERLPSTPQPLPDPTVIFQKGHHHPASRASDGGSAIVAEAGAFAGAPGEGLHRRDNIRFSHLGIHTSTTPGDDEITTNANNSSQGGREEDYNDPNHSIQPMIQTSTAAGGNNSSSIAAPSDGDDVLAEALPVDSDHHERPDLKEARPYNIDEAKQKKLEEAKRQRKYYLVLALVFGCIVVGVILGVVFHNENKDSKRNPPPTLAPSTTAPTDSPSSAPSGVLDYLMESLPEQTLESICCDTPQYKGRDWLLNHPNISNLEEWRKKQLFALATFYYSLEGENWNPLIRERWMDYRKEECLWYSSGFGWFLNGEYQELPGFLQTPSCNDDGEFTSLWLQDLQLSGFAPSMPPEIALLTSLTNIALYEDAINASLSDMLPLELFQLTNLKRVDLDSNVLTGRIPSELGLMTSLTHLSLSYNSLTGSIPQELALMTRLTWLQLDDNALTGQLPSKLSFMTSLWSLGLHNNALTGQLPSELGLMTSLSSLGLYGNALTGQLPSELGLMTSLVDISLFQNGFTGSIPKQLALITNLYHMKLENNELTGFIPSELESLMVNEYLTVLTLANNSLSGTIPQGFCSLGVFDESLGNYGMGLSFDCNDQLCGCCWCPCPNSNYSNSCQTKPT